MSDLDQLEAQALAADAGAEAMDTPPENEVAQEPVTDYAKEARGTVDMLTAMIVGYAPKTEAVWTEAAKVRVAWALEPVLEKYGFSFGAMPCELTLAIVAGPLLWQSSRMVAAQMAQEKAEQEAKEKPKAVTTEAQVQAAKPPQPPLAPDSAEHGAPKPEIHPQMALYKK